MRKIVLIVMMIGMMCMTGCSFIGNETDEPIEVNQKIVLIYRYLNYSDTVKDWGFYVDSKGNKISYNFSEIPRKDLDGVYDGLPSIYQFLTESQEADSEEFLTPEDVSKCYQLLPKISDDYDIVEKCAGKDGGSYCWYGVLDDGVNPPKFILLAEKGDFEGVNTDKNAKKIMKILNKTEWTKGLPVGVDRTVNGKEAVNEKNSFACNDDRYDVYDRMQLYRR